MTLFLVTIVLIVSFSIQKVLNFGIIVDFDLIKNSAYAMALSLVLIPEISKKPCHMYLFKSRTVGVQIKTGRC